MPYLNFALFFSFAIAYASSSVAQPIASSVGQGMIVTRDSESGEFRAPTSIEFRALQQQQMRRSSARLVPSEPAIVIGPGGRRSVRLGESKLVYAVVVRDGEGKFVDQCIDGIHAAEQVVAKPAPAKHIGYVHENR